MDTLYNIKNHKYMYRTVSNIHLRQLTQKSYKYKDSRKIFA